MHRSVRLGVLLVPFLSAVAVAQQVVTYSAADTNNFSGWQNCYTCYCAPTQRTPTPGDSLNMTFTDTIGHSYVSIQVEVAWGVNCVGSTSAYSVAINGASLGAGSPGSTACSCYNPAGATVTQTFTLAPGNTNYVPNGTNVLRFTQTGSNYQFGIINNTSNWCVRLTITGLNQNPGPPQNVHQAADAGGGAQPVGYVSNSTIFFRGRVTDPDPDNTLGLQAEILPAGTPFAATVTGTLVQTAAAGFVPNGSVAEVPLNMATAGLPSGAYHWRVRAIDPVGALSPWVEFDPATIHFTTDFAPPTSPGGPLAPSQTQIVYLEPFGVVPFTWGSASDTSGPPVPIYYRLEVSTSSAFLTTVHDQTSWTPNQDVNLNASATPYYWRVSAVDQAGNQSAPTGLSSFMLSWTVPEDVEDKHPNCGVTGDAGSPGALSMAALATLLGFMAARRRAA